MSLARTEISVELPASKSIANRWLVLNFLMDQSFHLKALGSSTDTLELAAALQQIKRGESSLQCIDAGSGGTGFRFIMALLSRLDGHFFLTGSQQILQRPHQQLIAALQSLGTPIEAGEKDGRKGYFIQGKAWQFNEVKFTESISSQYLSAIALAAVGLKNNFTIRLPEHLPSSPYLDITVACLQQAGINVTADKEKIQIHAGKIASAKTIAIEKDWSAAAFFYALLAGKPGLGLYLPGLKLNSLQADKEIVALGKLCGIQTLEKADGILLFSDENHFRPKEIKVDFFACPDLFPAVLTACILKGIALRAEGIQHLVHKESNRILAMQQMAHPLGYTMIENGDAIVWKRGSETSSKQSILPFKTHQDHRIAMCALIFKSCLKDREIDIDDTQCIAKSFPDFMEELRKIEDREIKK
jgi:3-phosphoshikimate 1-carboxyvinyltransferase